MARILVVDDEPAMGMLIVRILRPHGHQIVATTDGRDGLAKLRRHEYDLVILDIMMPDMDGYEFMEHLREIPERAHTAVLVVTGRQDPDGLQREVELGAIGHVQKPFTANQLEQAVKEAIRVEFRPRRDIMLEAELYTSVSELVEEARHAGEGQ